MLGNLSCYGCCKFETYGKFYYESVVILYNTQNKSKFKLHFIYMLGFMGK